MSQTWASWASNFRKPPRKEAAEKAAHKAAEKAHSVRIKGLQECEDLLAKYLAKDPGHRRTLKDQEEYHLLKQKVDQGLELNSVEKERLRCIIRNVQRRDYKLSLDRNLATKASQAEQDNTPNGTAGKIDSGEGVGSSAVDLPGSPTPAREQASKKGETAQTARPPDNQVSTAPGTNDEEIIFEDAEDSDVEMTDADADDEEAEIDAPECFWEYNVYRTDTGDPAGCTDAVYLSTYLSKARAEARVREEIKSAHSNLWDRTRMEVRAIFENGGFQGQSLEFASGRVVDVRIEKNLIEGQSTVRVKRACRQKLESLPVKVYVILENMLEMEAPEEESSLRSGSPLSDHGESVDVDITIPSSPPTIQPVWTECFALRNHANAQASRRMMEHLTSHLPEEQKFDVGMTGSHDTEARHYLHELEEGERLYNKSMILPQVGPDEKKRQITIRVMELLLRGPRN